MSSQVQGAPLRKSAILLPRVISVAGRTVPAYRARSSEKHVAEQAGGRRRKMTDQQVGSSGNPISPDAQEDAENHVVEIGRNTQQQGGNNMHDEFAPAPSYAMIRPRLRSPVLEKTKRTGDPTVSAAGSPIQIRCIPHLFQLLCQTV